MNSRELTATSPEHEIDLVALWWIIWDHRYLVAATTAVCAIIAVILALTATPIYRGTAVVTEVHETGGLAGASSMVSQLGGLASLAGLSLGANGPDLERQAVLHSNHLVEEFIKRNGVLPLLSANSKRPPSLWFAVQVFNRSVLSIEEDKLKGTTTITMDWTDPVTAARWANEFVALANDLLRARAIADSTRNIAYLNDQIAHTNQLEVQRVMYNLIEVETKTLMLAKGRIEYGFTNVDPAVVPEVRVSPKRTLMVLSGMVIGVFLGAMIAWVRTRFARRVSRSGH